jgi:ATP-binding cassette subfamily B protein
MFRWLWRYIRRYRVPIIFGLACTVVVSALNMVNPKVGGMIVDKVIIGNQKNLIWILIGTMLAATLAKALIRYAYQTVFEHCSQNIIRNMREDMYDHVQGLDFSFFDKTKTGDVMTLMTSDLDAVRHFFSWVLYQTFESILALVFAVSLLFSINWSFTLVMLTVTPFIAFFAVRLAFRVKPAYTNVRDQFSRLSSTVQENIAGNRVVKAFTREEFEIAKFQRENEAYKRRTLDAINVSTTYTPFIDAFSGILPMILILGGGALIIWGKLTLGELVTFNGLLWALSGPLSMSGLLVNDIMRFKASLERVYQLASRKTSIESPKDPITVGRAQGKIEFRHVSFAYNEAEVLHDVNLCVEPGMTVGILGPTGSGKSTLAKLLCRYYDCSSGEILVDGVNVNRYDLGSLRSNVGITMQDVFLFSDTIEGNIAFGKPDAPFEEIKRCAELSNSDEFVRGMPEGYDTIVGERGVGLSGGQRQRIALARLLLKDPPIMIMDDTTSSVDVETEERIRKSIGSLTGKHTMFVIAHRVSSIMGSDLILVMEKGRITQRGTHAELSRQKGYYRDVWLHQTGREEAAEGRN